MSPPLLDHVFVVVDDDSYRAVGESAYLSQTFARVKHKRSTSTLAGTYAAVVVAGVNTSVEFFPASAPPFPGLAAGLVLAFESPGAIVEAHRLLTERAASPVRLEQVRRTLDGSDQPRSWYTLLEPEMGPNSPIRLMLAEVAPEYLAAVGAAPSPDGRLSRRAYLDAAFGRPAADGQPLRDVTEVTLRLHADRARCVVTTLTTLGYRVTGGPHGQLLTGPDAVIRVQVDEASPEGVPDIRLVCQEPVPRLRLGATTLEADRWTFPTDARRTDAQQTDAGSQDHAVR
jgi:hypothetical protein